MAKKPKADLNAFNASLQSEEDSFVPGNDETNIPENIPFEKSSSAKKPRVLKYIKRGYELFPRQVKQVGIAAAKKGCSKSEIVRAAIDQYLGIK